MSASVQRHGDKSALVSYYFNDDECTVEFIVPLKVLSQKLLWGLMICTCVNITELEDFKSLFDYHCHGINRVSLIIDKNSEES